jgi:hypothetical protein
VPIFDSDVLPEVDGRALGNEDARWNAKIRDLDVSGIVTGNFAGLAINNIGHIIVPFSVTPIFDNSIAGGFDITLTNNVGSSAFINLRAGSLVAFVIRQDITGGRTFVWPPNVFGGADIGTDPSNITAQIFYCTGTTLIALTPGLII